MWDTGGRYLPSVCILGRSPRSRSNPRSLSIMARTKQTARKSCGGIAPRKLLATKQGEPEPGPSPARALSAPLIPSP